MKRTNQILARLGIDPGLATNGTIDLRQQSGRDLNEIKTTQQRRRNKPGKIANDTATEGNDQGGPFDPHRQNLFDDVFEHGKAFGLFTRRHDDFAVRNARPVKRCQHGR